MLKRFDIKWEGLRSGRLPATLSLGAITVLATWMGMMNGGFFIADWVIPALIATLACSVFAAGVGVVAATGHGDHPAALIRKEWEALRQTIPADNSRADI
jgi:ribose/xylose/arabinose/galactoside ABC-type transport system permease subunit